MEFNVGIHLYSCPDTRIHAHTRTGNDFTALKDWPFLGPRLCHNLLTPRTEMMYFVDPLQSWCPDMLCRILCQHGEVRLALEEVETHLRTPDMVGVVDGMAAVFFLPLPALPL